MEPLATVATPKETEESKADVKRQQPLSLKSVGPRGSLTPYNLRPSETLKMKLSAESIKNACKGTPGWTRKSVRRKLNLGQGLADSRAGSVEKENVEPEPTFEEFKSDVLDSSQLHHDDDDDEDYEAARGQSQEDEAFLSAREETYEGAEAGDEETLQGDEIAVSLGPDVGHDDREPSDCNGEDGNVPTDSNKGDQLAIGCKNDDQVPSDDKNDDQVPADSNSTDRIKEIPIPETPVMNETFIKTDDLPLKTEEVKPDDNAQLKNAQESSQLPQTVSSCIHDLSVEPNKENKPRPKSKVPLANKSVHFSTVSKLSRVSAKPKPIKPALSSRKSVAVAIPRSTKSLMPIKSLVPKKSAIPRTSKVAEPSNKAAERNLRKLERLLQPPNLKSYQRHTIASAAKARPSQLFPASVVVVPELEKAPEAKRRLTVVGNNMTRKSERVPFRLY